jgi:hypothetical protein
MIGTIVIMFFGLLSVTAGGLLGELIHHAATGQLRRFYVLHPTQVYVTLGVTVVTAVFLWLCVRDAIAERAKAIEEREFADVSFGVTGISYRTTPWIRAAVFIGMYVLGVGLFAFFA